jgi:hypothetical protein
MTKGWVNGVRVYVFGWHGALYLKLRPVSLGPGEYTFTAMFDAVLIDKDQR